MTSNYRVEHGSLEYINAVVTASVDLDSQPVEISVDNGVTWLPAGWQGSVGKVRTARTSTPFQYGPANKAYPIRVRLTDTPEVPILNAGTIVTN